MIALHGRHLRPLALSSTPEPFLARIVTSPTPVSDSALLLVERGVQQLPAGFRGYLVRGDTDASGLHDVYDLRDAFDYLADGDIVRIDPSRRALAVLYRRSSAFNSMLVTERCDNYCVMCSQPPKARDDAWLVDDLETIIPWMSPETPEIGLTGGEPGLLGERLVTLIAQFERRLPATALHILSNGRAFRDAAFARAVAGVRHHDLVVGIPLYGPNASQHDFVVQSRGAFEDTLRGILNLKGHGVRVELRFVIHAETHAVLPEFARFVARNLLFIDHVALMGLEPMGFARSNLDALWIDPVDYQDELREAAQWLVRARIPTSIYNHQLCVLDPALHGLARRSISDWKNRWFEACMDCDARSQCGGFFASNAARRSRGITPLRLTTTDHEGVNT